MTLNFKLLSFAGAFALASFSVALQGKVLRYTPKKGEVHKYRVTLKFSVQGSKVEVHGTSTHKITKVAPNGYITLDTKDTNPTITVNGAKVAAPDTNNSHETSVIRPDGTVANVGGHDVSADRYREETLHTFLLPNFALAVGKVWTWNCKADPKTGVVKAKGTFKVIGSEVLLGTPVWKVSTKVIELTGSQPASCVGTEWISKVDGTTVSVKVTDSNMPFPGAPGPITARISMERIS
jgi:hypothetical protein